MDKVSDTPRTAQDALKARGEHYEEKIERLERELAAQKEQYRVLTDEMLVMMDERNAAVAALHVNAGENCHLRD